MRSSILTVARLWAVLALVLSFARPIASQPENRYTTAALHLRAEASTEGAPLVIMPRGATVTSASCSPGWCQVEYRGRSGYAARRFLSRNRPSTRATPDCRAGGRVDSRGRWIPARCSRANGPPAGAAARCRDGTYMFNQPRRTVCSSHGGVSRWL